MVICSRPSFGITSLCDHHVATRRLLTLGMAREHCGCGCTSTNLQLQSRKQWYDKAFARLMSRSSARYNRIPALDARKRQLLAPLVEDKSISDVLEIGVGSGSNLEYFAAARKDMRLTGVDPNTWMQPYLEASCQAVGFPLEQLTFVQGIAEELPLPDSSQDVVISTLVLCSVADQRAAVAEVLRVLRPGGRFLFMEHVAAPLGSWTRLLQELVTPAWRVIADGCSPNRETWQVIKSGGFSSCEMQHFSASDSPFLALIAPHISGSAVK